MHLKQLIALAYAISAGALALGLTAAYMRTFEQEAQFYYSNKMRANKVETEPKALPLVVTLATTLPYGHKLTESDLKEVPWQADAVPPGSYRSIREFLAAHKEPVAKIALSEGEVLLPAKLVSESDRSILSLLLADDMRAVTIKVNEVRGVGGFIQPRDRVDILMTEKSTATEKGKQQHTSVLLQNVLILAIGQNVSAQNYKPTVANSVTVAVGLEDAQKLALAITIGHLSLALRNPLQVNKKRLKEVSLTDLRPGTVQAPPSTPKIRVYRSAKPSDYPIDESSK